jgi:hypothetical protein
MPFKERRKVPRTLVSRELVRVDRLNRVFQVRELSPHSCSLVWEDPLAEHPFHILQYVQGVLSTSMQRLGVQLQVQGILQDQVRARLFLNSKLDEEMWWAYFAPERLASSLRMVPFDVTNQKLLFLGDADTSLLLALGHDARCQEVSIRARGYFLRTHLQEGTQIGYDDPSLAPRPGALTLQLRESTTEPHQFQEAAGFFLRFIETFGSRHEWNEDWIVRTKKEIEDQCHKLK